MSGVLDGLKVLDLSWGIAGPMTAMLLADHGAQVTRIERPEGDPFSHMLGYKVWNRGKRSAVLNLKDAGENALFLKLAADADVLIESFSPGVTKRLGIDYDTLAAINPKLIYCSITAYGEGTPDQDRKGYDALVAARVGLQFEQRGYAEGAVWHMTGRENPFVEAADIQPEWVQGADREGPLFVSSPWPSLGAFFSASTGVAAALFAREKTGRGQKVSTSLQQGAMACAAGVWQRMEEPDAPGFNTWILSSKSPKGHFQCKDGRWVHNWVPNPRFILGASAGDTLNASPDLTVQNDPDRFGIGPEELLVMAHYQPILQDAISKFSAAEWVEAARVAEMTMQECRSLEESLTDPLLIDDRCVTTVDDPELGPINQVGITYRLSNSQGAVQGPAHARGADTGAVKAEAAALPDPVAATAKAPAGDAPLKGIRVLDLGLAIAGPFGCQLLADLGAEVIKINALWDTYWHKNHIAYVANRGKSSIALMLKHPKAMAILKELIASADVVQHNMRYDAAQRLGIDYETLSKEHPRLIYCHTRGFEKGPRMGLPGNDQTGACLAGIQHEDGAIHAGGKPIWSLSSLGDTGNGFLSAVGILNALKDRERTGKGQFVDTSIINACLLNTSYAIAKPDGAAIPRPRLDKDQTGFSGHYRLYQAQDGWVQVAAVSDAEKAAFDRLAGDDAAGFFAGRTAALALMALAEAGVPGELSDDRYSLGLFDNALFKQRNWTTEYHDPAVGKLEQVGLTYELSGTPGVIQGPPLIVGKDTAAILHGLGYDEAGIDALAGEGAIACDPPRATQQQMKSPWQ
ncbi:Crotonobetainyl-CoA:carnitine CoA-transferase CaiB [Sphingomonas laterariae]|uniref:Crotonobetainyl-CoA:carnitine CoA-transferase CaiB n=1 Tax=Edaphosphingomonas laterariae TaxID=861865 RepID=A0A239D597_9SPHN|nr:CoA transferase [Sphingomonas laterariae]SNS27322.1 Crotonobetainyl-CoA:carnitine CoA-transferase CaiB [Sphingomonas laterariae]